MTPGSAHEPDFITKYTAKDGQKGITYIILNLHLISTGVVNMQTTSMGLDVVAQCSFFMQALG